MVGKKPHLGKYVSAVGVELEGGWSREAYSHAYAWGAKFVRDGSVSLHNEPTLDKNGYVGEIPSPPLYDYGALKAFLVSCYPTALPRKWDPCDTCGLHIHISLRTRRQYMHLMSKDFFNAVYDYWRAWGARNIGPEDPQKNEEKPFWHRIRGETRYCAVTYACKDQVDASYKEECRYSALNYCYKLHGTLELRLLPMFDTWEQAFGAVVQWVDFVESYLASYDEKKAFNQAKVVVPDYHTVETFSTEPVEVCLSDIDDTIEHSIYVPDGCLGRDEITLHLGG